MITASAKYQAALTGSHTALARAVVLTPESNNTYSESATLAISSGNLTIDGRRNVWRQATIKVVPAQQEVLDPLRLITPDARLKIQRGIRFLDGSEEWVTVATLQVQEARESLNAAGLEVVAYDPGSAISDYNLVTPYAPLDISNNPLTTVDAIKDLVDIAVWDSITWTVDAGIDLAAVPPAGTVFTGSRWDAVTNLAKSLGAIVHARADGEWRIRKVDAGPHTPVATVKSGSNGVLVSTDIVRSRREQFNAVPLRWESPSGGGLVFLVDNDSNSPTFWNGPFGRKPASEQRVDTVSTEQQAIDAATTMLEEFKGYVSSVSFSMVHNPLLEPFDHILVEVDGVMEDHHIDSINYPLAGGVMSLETRKVSEI
jgi:hypothetical protein